MEILERRIFRGPSLYAHFPVIRLTVDLGPLEISPSAKIPGFNEKLLNYLPGLAEHGCSYGEPGGFVRRLSEDGGTWMGHILEHLAIELQHLSGANVTFGKTRSTGTDGEYHVVYSFEEEKVGMAAAELALKMIHHSIPEELCGKSGAGVLFSIFSPHGFGTYCKPCEDEVEHLDEGDFVSYVEHLDEGEK